jgi:hypothetical protein
MRGWGPWDTAVSTCSMYVACDGCVRVGLCYSLGGNGIGDESGVAIAGALRPLSQLTELEYVVGKGTNHEAAGCVG